MIGGYSRRSVMLAGGATLINVGCAGAPKAIDANADPLEGVEIYSESVQMSGASPDGACMFSIRLCQYPAMNIAWVWACLMTPSESFLFAKNNVEWTGVAADTASTIRAGYAAAMGDMRIGFERSGPHGAITAGRLEFQCLTERPFSVVAAFVPSDGFTGLIEGRSEMFGRVEASIMAGGESYSFIGRGQWHEQPQSAPRFTIPFIYASLWGERVSATLLQTPEGSGGYALRPDMAPEIFPSVRFSPPGEVRSIWLASADGGLIEFKLRQRHHYALPIYGRNWIGTFVDGEFLGDAVSGFVNNWIL